MRKVKYKVTGDFGSSPLGEIREAYVLLTDSDSITFLLYHPRETGLCASLEMCVQEDDYFVTARAIERYINVESQRHLRKLISNLEKLSYRDNQAKVLEEGKE